MASQRSVVIASACLSGLLSGVVYAQPRVLIAAAASASTTDCRYTDVQNKLIATGSFLSVDVHNASNSTTAGSVPLLSQLQNYDVVLTWSNTPWSNTIGMGDVLADYVDGGGAVVVGVFANASIPLGGRWITGGYEVIIGGSGQTQGTVTTLGTIHIPGHPIMANVNSFSGGTQSFRPTITDLTPGAFRVADWSDGRALIAVGANPKRVDIGFYPVSSDCSAAFWTSSTDGARLLANALLFAAGTGTPTCYANCDSSTQPPVLNVADFTCFLQKFAAGDSYANCDESTQPPVLNVADFTCFLQKFAAGCR